MFESSNSLFKQLNWLTNSDEIEIRKCCLIYKRIYGLTPDYIDNILVRNADLHLRTTRHSNVNLVCPRYKRESEGGRTFQVSATKLWNTIPTNIKKRVLIIFFTKQFVVIIIIGSDHIVI